MMHQMGRGGIETWLEMLARQIDLDAWPMDVLCCTGHERNLGEMVEPVKRAGIGSIFVAGPLYRLPPVFTRRLRKINREHGPYLAVHSHVHWFDGIVLRAAEKVGIPSRISYARQDLRSPADQRLDAYLAEVKRNTRR